MLPLIFINKIKINNMETKQETIEEAAEKYFDYNIFCDGITDFEKEISIRSYIAGAKWQQERMYSEEEVFNLLCKMPNYFKMTIAQQPEAIKEWFKEFKKQ